MYVHIYIYTCMYLCALCRVEDRHTLPHDLQLLIYFILFIYLLLFVFILFVYSYFAVI